jgi:hypothetical protein
VRKFNKFTPAERETILAEAKRNVVDHETVGTARRELEQGGGIRHVSRRTEPNENISNVPNDGIVRKRNKQNLVYKTRTPEPERIERRVEHESTDDAWNAWLRAGIEAERDFMREVMGGALGKMADEIAKEARAYVEAEMKVVNGRIDMLRDAIAGLQKRDHAELAGLHRESSDRASELGELRERCKQLHDEVKPWVHRLQGDFE